MTNVLDFFGGMLSVLADFLSSEPMLYIFALFILLGIFKIFRIL